MMSFLKPASAPHPSVLRDSLGITAIGGYESQSEVGAFESHVKNAIQRCGTGLTIMVEDAMFNEGSCLRSYGIASDTGPAGTLTVSTGKDQAVSVRASLLWIHVQSLEAVEGALDQLAQYIRMLYAFDVDDFAIQNLTMAIGMEHWGVSREQAVFHRGSSGIQVIDTRNNPGFLESSDGCLRSLQWLTYWHVDWLQRLCGNDLSQLPSDVAVTHLSEKIVKLRLAPAPGRYDDVEYHRLQVRCREALALK